MKITRLPAGCTPSPAAARVPLPCPDPMPAKAASLERLQRRRRRSPADSGNRGFPRSVSGSGGRLRAHAPRSPSAPIRARDDPTLHASRSIPSAPGARNPISTISAFPLEPRPSRTAVHVSPSTSIGLSSTPTSDGGAGGRAGEGRTGLGRGGSAGDPATGVAGRTRSAEPAAGTGGGRSGREPAAGRGFGGSFISSTCGFERCAYKPAPDLQPLSTRSTFRETWT